MKILDGKILSEKILTNLKKEVKSRHLRLRLAVILVGEDPTSQIFVRQKQKACEKVGIGFRFYGFEKNIGESWIKKEIVKIIGDEKNSGVIIQLPLPPHINTQEILNLIPFQKDIDVLSENSLGKFSQNALSIMPPTVCAISRLLKSYQVKVRGKNIVVVGAGRLVGYPLAIWFLQEKATVSVLNRYTKDAQSFTKNADILISGVGKPNLIKYSMIKVGAVVIDAGTSIRNDKLVGDVDFESVSKKASHITPVPGGVGPMTVACLLENLITLNKARRGSR